jgi:CIC family chloride channel protein
MPHAEPKTPSLEPHAAASPKGAIPSTITQSGSPAFWLAAILIGVGTGCAAAALTQFLYLVQHFFWFGDDSLLKAAARASAWRRIGVLLGAGLVTGMGQLLLKRLSSGNSTDITAAIWFNSGRLPPLRTWGTAVLSVVIVAMGASLGREGAPKQAGAVIANATADRVGLSDEQRRLLVACGAGAGMSAAYGVPIGGALFALEVLRGKLALRLILPALVTSIVAVAVSWLALPNAPTYPIPDYRDTASLVVWTLFAGPLLGLASVGYVKAAFWADRGKPKGSGRLVSPLLALGGLGLASIWFPQLLGNGKDVSALAFSGDVAPWLLLTLAALKPMATILCLRSGAPGGLFTPTLTFGAMLGGTLGHVWCWMWPGTPEGAFALVGAAAMLAATTQGPISTIVLMMELTGRDRSCVIALLFAVAAATLTARAIDPRSIYDSKLSDAEVEARLAARETATA